MPSLDRSTLVNLRLNQIQTIERCPKCTALTWINYCREHDEFFRDGHWPACEDYVGHSGHRKY